MLLAVEAFDKWSKLASDVGLNLSDDHLDSLCCNENHPSSTCCSTSSLVSSLQNLGGFGSSVKVHVLAQHVNSFARRHRILGAVAEEGIEGLHRIIKNDLENVCRGDEMERLKIALQRHAIQVQLDDLGKSAN